MVCSKCKIDRKLNEFSKRKKGYCLPCNRKYQRFHYLTHKTRYRRQRTERKLAIKELINLEKSKPCTDCRKKYPYCVMDFDHKSDKKFNVSQGLVEGYSWERIKKEIDKCELVCANCHRIRTFNALSSNG